MYKKILLSEAAYYDMDSVFSYVSQDNKKAAEMLRSRLYKAITQLADFPEKGAVLPEEDAPGAERGYRRIVQNPYIIFYRVLDDKIVIARVLHGRQNWLQSLFEISEHE
ncbi:MAG: type II toxin-antitoxin system RelE/ParE family toxin [Dethiobacter sp.]|jgi:toxin ParE1/3/4|nr:type II toxin-antitoxin system RelE/ParE family toxin [Dethiobacter sp.]MBS3983607.1 type II toxin-antitoxin system RelE/ParE family toxin [Dethiobacter sp.]MCL4464086.1 type II toxin-antitoxin system RelE/ParE family toxin [Bacillota bacterium]